MMNNDTIEVLFMHPRNSEITLTADLSPNCTGHDALQALLLDEDGTGAFLSPPNEDYILTVQKTKQAIDPEMTFAQAGVANGDAIRVVQKSIGAAIIRPASTGIEQKA
jgi:hypothetical protein